MYYFTPTVALATLSIASAAPLRTSPYKHVAVFSVDGLHASDLDKYVALRPKSNISALLKTGYQYSGAYTSAPSDSFPGTVSQFTGASPRTTGVWYDDIWNRNIFAPGSNCTGTPGYNSMRITAWIEQYALIFPQPIRPRIWTTTPPSSSVVASIQLTSLRSLLMGNVPSSIRTTDSRSIPSLKSSKQQASRQHMSTSIPHMISLGGLAELV